MERQETEERPSERIFRRPLVWKGCLPMYHHFDDWRNLFFTGSGALLEESAAGADGVLGVFVVDGIELVQGSIALFGWRTRRGQAGNGLAGMSGIACQQLAGIV